jgi:hypothetical protein
MEQCQILKTLILKEQEMDENHCRVLGTFSRPDLKIVMDCCKITSAGACALAEVLGRNQGPIKLDLCEIDISVFANGFRGSSRLKSLSLHFSSSAEDGNREVLGATGALGENKGLVNLNPWHNFRMSDKTWDAICDSLKTHPTHGVLDLRGTAFTVATTTSAVLKSLIQTLLNMMKINMSIIIIRLHDRSSQHEIFREAVIPYLEANRLRPHLLAIQKTRPFTSRAKILERALLPARTDGNKCWMRLSGNAESAFPSRRSTTIAAAMYEPPSAFYCCRYFYCKCCCCHRFCDLCFDDHCE